MNLIVVGQREETRTLVRMLQAADPQAAAYFADYPAALEAIGNSGARFVLAEAKTGGSDYRKFADAIRIRHGQVPIALLSYDAEPAQPKLFGVFEKAPGGLRVLNCIITEPHARAEGNCARDLGQIIFEYQPGPQQG